MKTLKNSEVLSGRGSAKKNDSGKLSGLIARVMVVLAFLTASDVIAQEQFKPSLSGAPREMTIKLPFADKPGKVNVEVIDNMVVLEGDIILGPLVSFEGENAVSINGTNYRWPNSTIPYRIEANHPKRNDILWAIEHISSNTNICLVARTTQNDYINFISGSGCSSYVGRQGGRQDIVIGSCSRGSIAHEICHSAGLYHEQSREDRDRYITINAANIAPGRARNFDKHVSDATDIGGYDYGSIMHYPANAFSRNNQPTIVVKVPPGTASTVIGQRTGLSSKDKRALNRLYQEGPCKCNNEDCITLNPALVTVRQNGNNWQVVNSTIALFSAPTKAEAKKIEAIIKHYKMDKSCFVGRPDASFHYMLKNGASPTGAFQGEDCIGFNPATLEIKTVNGRIKIVDGNNWLFDFGNKRDEADKTLCLIRKYGFTKTCYVGRPDPSFTYMRK